MMTVGSGRMGGWFTMVVRVNQLEPWPGSLPGSHSNCDSGAIAAAQPCRAPIHVSNRGDFSLHGRALSRTGFALREGAEREEVKSAPRSPWQNPYAERLIGSIRRDCLDHVIVLNEWHLRRILRSYIDYYHGSRTHLSLKKDSPEPRPVHPPDMGDVVEFPEVGGLHHRYERRAAA